MAPFGRFFLMDELHSDTVSRRFRARHAQLEGGNKLLEIRIFSLEISADPQFLEGFRAEMKAALGLNHPNLVQIHDCGTAKFEGEKCAYVVTEHLVGKTLTDLLNHLYAIRKPGVINRVPLSLTQGLVDTLARTLFYAHQFKDPLTGSEAGVAHRDFSSDSIFLTFDGFVKVSGFGTAQAYEQQERTVTTTSSRRIVGYLAPEQLNPGSPITDRVDQFALAVLAWELLTGQRLFEGKTPFETLQKIADEKFRIPAPSLFNPTLSRELDSACLRALSRDPRQRFENLEFFRRAFVDAISPILRSQVAPPVTLEAYIGGIFSDEIRKELDLIQALSREAEKKLKGDLSSVELNLSEANDVSLALISAPSGKPDTKRAPEPAKPRKGQVAMRDVDVQFGSSDEVIRLDRDEESATASSSGRAVSAPIPQRSVTMNEDKRLDAKASAPREHRFAKVILAGALFGLTAFLWVSPVTLDGLVEKLYHARYGSLELFQGAAEEEKKDSKVGTQTLSLELNPRVALGLQIKSGGKFVLPTRGGPTSLQLPEGQVTTLSVRVVGFREWRQTIAPEEIPVQDDGRRVIRAQLEADPFGFVTIDSDMRAQARAKGTHVEFEFEVPTQDLRLPPGVYELMLKTLSFNEERRMEFRVEAEKLTRIQVSMAGVK